jgi:hypothetical protein
VVLLRTPFMRRMRRVRTLARLSCLVRLRGLLALLRSSFDPGREEIRSGWCGERLTESREAIAPTRGSPGPVRFCPVFPDVA